MKSSFSRTCRLPLMVGLAIVCAVTVMAETAKSLKGTRPNVILILTDDVGKGDLACEGNQVLNTPNFDRLYASATRLTDFHVSPTCSPTRSAIMSGRHEFSNGVTHTIKERERMALSTTTFPQLLQKAGYATGIFGKWHLGDEDAYQPYNRGFDEVLIHGAGGIGQSYKSSCGDFPPNVTSKTPYFDNVLLHNDTIVRTKGFCTDIFTQAALAWIKEQLEAKKPFFAYIPYNAAHGPYIAPDSYKKRFLDAGWDDKTAGRFGMIENIDDNLGLILTKINEWNARENTLIIFLSDNGQSLSRGKKEGKSVELFNANFKTGKGTPFEGGTHVPSYWSWKGRVAEGVDVPALTAHIDFFRTICDLAGVEIPAGIQPLDGRSLLPLLENPKAVWPDRTLFIHTGRWNSAPDDSKYADCAVRTQRWRMVMSGKIKDGSKPGVAKPDLYDISVDPYERKNVAGEHPEVIAQLMKEFDRWWSGVRPLMVNEGVTYTEGNTPQALRYAKQLKERGIPEWSPPKL